MNNLPSKIKVSCYDIAIKQWHPESANAKENYGQFSSQDLSIGIDASVHPVKLVDTLIHEVYHAIFWTGGLKDEDDEERTVGVLATGFTQVCRDNPELVKFIQSNLNGG